MKTLPILLVMTGIVACLLITTQSNSAHGMWIPQSLQELLEGSNMIFVGNITSVNVLQIEKQSSYTTKENGTDKNYVENYTINLDEYKVDVEEFLKNPQSSNKITVRQPTIPNVDKVSAFEGLKAGDRVLFYVKTLGGINEYSPESIIIPKSSMGKDVLTQKRLEMGGELNTIQNGNKVDYGNFTANKPVQFVYNKDVGTLSGKSFDVIVYITKTVGQNTEIVFTKEIHAESKQCEWIAATEWEFTPQKGDYGMSIRIKEGDSISNLSDTGFSVKSDIVTHNQMSPLQQFKLGIAARDVICKEGLQLVIRAENSSPACVMPQSAKKLIQLGWAMQGEKNYHIYFPGRPPPVVDTRIAKIVSGTQEAQSVVGYRVDMSHYLPPGYSIQAILVDNYTKFVKILASTFPITQNTTNVEFMDNRGILIYMEPLTLAFNQTNWTTLWLNQTSGSSTIKIAGYDGVINDIMKGKRFDEEWDIPAELIIFRNDAMVEISGFVHSDELIKIAESMLKS